ncbi:MAG: D-hexose-6-phosphate mutarotase [Verrucomicrobiota bacterium]
MSTGDVPAKLKQFEIPGRVTFQEGNGELPKLEITTAWSTAEIYLHGAHVTSFQKKGEPPLLFMSQCSRFVAGQPIRGGVPVIFPWFGPREGMPMHGFARLASWELHEATALPEGGVTLRFSLPEVDESATFPPCNAHYVVTVTDKLELELIITNPTPNEPFTFDTCLHTYFQVGDISAVSVSGLKGLTYLDKVENFATKTETAETIQVAAEVDRIYLDTHGPALIQDAKLRRIIRVETSGSRSTVVWNPWIAKARQMPDFGDDEYREMICVESGNVDRNKLTLAPGHSVAMKVVLSSEPLPA